MTPRRRAELQERILDAAKAAEPGTLDRELAAAIGHDRSHVSRLRSGERTLKIDDLVCLVRAFGAQAVLGPIAARDGCRVVSDAQEDARRDLGQLGLELGGAVGPALSRILDAIADGEIDPEETDDILRALAPVEEAVRQIRARLIPTRLHPVG